MRRRNCCACVLSSRRKRRIAIFYAITQLEMVADAEETLKNTLRYDFLGHSFYDTTNRRISLINTAIDALLAVYPSLYGGEPF